MYKSSLSALLYFGYGIDLDSREVSQFMKGIKLLGFKPDKPVLWNVTRVVDHILNCLDNSIMFLTQKFLFFNFSCEWTEDLGWPCFPESKKFLAVFCGQRYSFHWV